MRRSARTSIKTQAQELHDRLKSDLWRQAELNETPDYLWDDAGARWLKEHTHKADFKHDIEKLRWLQPFLRGVPLKKIDRETVLNIVHQKRQETTPATANRYLALIRSILRASVEWGWIPQAPMLRQLPEPKRRIRWLTKDEAQRLLNELPAHLRDMAEFSLVTGLRKANVTGLQWSQLDLDRCVAWIHPDQAKAKKAIGVPLNDQAVQILKRQKGKHPQYVFTYQGNPVLQTNTRAWGKALRRAGISDFRWHDLRHTWASWHVQAGTPLHALQELGGWESVEMVRRYAHLAPEHLHLYAGNAQVETKSSTSQTCHSSDGEEPDN
ncbi:tyrosine-type recombinase/integrase [Candidatus Igneacidithiobacillus taiwanensis]|uniref:tyrosine-type recombinase/integrase n=1 Tax=Candidatus Igneacidithiobacillus taiwanensis TaxID=1945924 RepID=UPI0039171AF2